MDKKIERIWICVSPDVFRKLKKQAVERGFSTRTKLLLYEIEQYQGETLMKDWFYNTKNRKITSIDACPADAQLITEKAALSGMKQSVFLRNLAYTITNRNAK